MSGIPAGAGQLLGKRLGKFEIVALLALGGTAEIYLARIDGAAGFEKYVVVKCLHDHLADDAEFVKMFLDEARLAAHLDHSNIVQTMELGQHENRYYMVMEFLAGLSLAMIVRRAADRLPGGKLPVPLVINMLAQAAAGLHYAHDKAMNGKPLNIVHRDISPQNLVISFEGMVKVVDFGIAKAEMRETHTRSGTIKGKFAYMSPEQCVANNVDRRTDVFALGVIGHELLTGRRLFKRPSPYETYQAVLECEVKPPSQLEPGVDPDLDAVIMRAITKEKEPRYPTAEAFGDALLGYLHQRGIGSGPSDVSRFFEHAFAQEIDEHTARMRELIAGRDVVVEAGWGSGGDDGEEEKSAAAGRAGAAAKLAASEAMANAPRAGHGGGAMRSSSSSDTLDRAGEPNAGGEAAGERPSVAALSSLIADLGDLAPMHEDDEMPAERTRIESNPLEKVNELERMLAANKAAGGAPAPVQRKSEQELERVLKQQQAEAAAKWAASRPRSEYTPPQAPMPPVMPLGGPHAGTVVTLPPREPMARPSEATMVPALPFGVAMPADAAPGGTVVTAMPAMMHAPPPPVMPLGGPPGHAPPPQVMPLGGPVPLNAPANRFPDPANLPTMVAAEIAEQPAGPPASPGAKTIAIPSGVIGGGHEFAHTQIAPMETPFDNSPPTMPAELAYQPGTPPTIPPPPVMQAPLPPPSLAPTMPPPGLPPTMPPPGARPAPGYPVMSAEMRSQIENGATVFPSDAQHAHAHAAPHGYPPRPDLGSGGSPPLGANGYPMAQMAGTSFAPPGFAPPGFTPTPPGMPMSGAYAPSVPVMTGAMGTPTPMDPQRAAAVMSPVGAQYPVKDWTAVAAAKVRVLPHWLLALLFISALAIALTLTIFIARVLTS